MILKNVVLFTVYTFFLWTIHTYTSANFFRNTTLNPEQEILGTWYMANSPGDKLEFTADGYLRRYVNNVLQSTSTYSISNSCDGITSTNDLFLVETDISDNDTFCFYINGINENNSNEMSLTVAGRMEVTIFVR